MRPWRKRVHARLQIKMSVIEGMVRDAPKLIGMRHIGPGIVRAELDGLFEHSERGMIVALQQGPKRFFTHVATDSWYFQIHKHSPEQP